MTSIRSSDDREGNGTQKGGNSTGKGDNRGPELPADAQSKSQKISVVSPISSEDKMISQRNVNKERSSQEISQTSSDSSPMKRKVCNPINQSEPVTVDSDMTNLFHLLEVK